MIGDRTGETVAVGVRISRDLQRCSPSEVTIERKRENVQIVRSWYVRLPSSINESGKTIKSFKEVDSNCGVSYAFLGPPPLETQIKRTALTLWKSRTAPDSSPMDTTLSPSQLARSIGVSESSLKRWVDDGALAAVRTHGGHRRISLNEAVRFIRSIGATLVRPDLLGIGELADLPPNWAQGEDVADRLYRSLEAGDVGQSRALIHGLYVAGWSPAQIFDGPLRTAMSQIGTLWLHAEWGIVVEHRATNIAIQAISQLRLLMPAHRPDGPFAVGCALEGDPYLLPSLMASVTLAAVGFSDVNLGPITPSRVLANASEHYDAKLVWITASVIASEEAFSAEVVGLYERLRARGCRLVVGGRAVTPGIREAIAHRATLSDGMTELAAVGGELIGELKGVRLE